jgi:predicted transglutaminase-like cysteine proteinase
VNGSFVYRSDLELFGQRDYWELPPEVISHGAADCDGFAIFKMWLARLAGVSNASLAMVVGFRENGRMHAVLYVAGTGHDDVLGIFHGQVIEQQLHAVTFRPLLLLTLDDIHLFLRRESR